MVKYGMVIDLDKCVACQACTLGCKTENNLREGEFWQHVIPIKTKGKYPTSRVEFYPRPCFHCENPPCVDVCPTKASYKREDDGVVLIDYDLCIGCKYCIVACPYEVRYATDRKPTPGVPSYKEAFGEQPEFSNPELSIEENERFLTTITAWSPKPKGVVSKCHFCAHRQDKAKREGKKFANPDGDITTACNEACPSGARSFGDLDDPNSEVSRLIAARGAMRIKENLGTEPKVYYLR